MNDVTVTCDRCGKQIEGIEHETATGGFYRIKVDGEGWGKYTNPGERVVCDDCMWHDPRYLVDYPPTRRAEMGQA